MRVLNLFNWNFCNIINQLEMIKTQGFDCILVSPVQPINDDLDFNYQWWSSYCVKDYSIGNSLGSMNDLKKLCNQARLFDIKVIQEVVPPLKIVMSESDVCYRLLGLGDKIDISKEKKIEFLKFVKKLTEIGVSGFVNSFSQISLPNEQNYFYLDLQKTMIENGTLFFCYISNIEEERKSELNKYIIPITSYYDVDNKSKMKFVENQYSFYNLNFGITSMISSFQISKLYFDLCHDYNDTIYYARPYDDEWKSELIRNANNIKIEKVHILQK